MLLLVIFTVFARQCLTEGVSEIGLEQFLTVGKHLSCDISQGFPPLHRAAMTGNNQMATKILHEIKESPGNGANYHDSEGMTALHWAAMLGHATIVRSLLESGANVTSLDQFKNTPLHLATFAGDAKAVRWLIIFGADLNAKNQNGSTALHIAAEKDHFSIAEKLVSSCAAINATDYKGRTPLDMAVDNNNLAIETLLRASGAKSIPKPELFHWVNKTEDDFELPPCAVIGGKTYGGQTQYIGKIWDKKSYTLATIIPHHKKILSAIRGKYSEVPVSFQVLCGKRLAWKPIKTNDDIPETAVVAAVSRKGETFYIGRTYVSYSGTTVMTPGQISGTDRVLNVPFYSNDSIVSAKDYEILIVSF